MLCHNCKQLREKHSTHIVCNIQQAQMIKVEKCSFYEPQTNNEEEMSL